MRIRSGLAVAVCLAGQMTFAGEMSYQETTRITGGSAMSMMKFAGTFSKQARKLDKPIVTSVYLKDNRMARVSEDSIDITDLDAETITKIDRVKHQYSVVTFAQMKEAMQRAAEKAKTEQAKAQPNTQQTPADSNVDLSFEAHARKTGATKQVSGIDTSEVILTLAMNGKDKTNGQTGAMAVTNDMWMAPDVPGYAELQEFNRKFAVKMGTVLASGPDMSMLVKQVAASDAMKSLAKEMAEVKGVPVLQVMRMGMTANGQPLPAASEAPLPAESAAGNGSTLGSEIGKSTADAAQQTAAQEAASRVRGALGSGLGSAIGGFGGFGKKKKPAASQDSATTAQASSTSQAGAGPSSASAATAAVLIESVTEMGAFSQTVDPSVMQVPAGYQLVQSPELKRMGQ